MHDQNRKVYFMVDWWVGSLDVVVSKTNFMGFLSVVLKKNYIDNAYAGLNSSQLFFIPDEWN